MSDTVIYWFNLLRKYQPELFVFTNRKVWPIGDSYVNHTGIDGGKDENDRDGDENKAPRKIENQNDLKYQEDKEAFIPNRRT